MARRSRFGSVRRRPSGKWEARYQQPETKETFYRYFTTSEDAWDFLAITEAEFLKGEWLDPNQGARLLKVWADEWFAGKRSIRQRTREGYEYIVRVHIKPSLGDVPIGRLTAEQVDAWLTKLQENPRLGDSTVKSCYKVLNQIMRLAVQRRYVRFNPCETVTPPGESTRDQLFLEPKQVGAIAEAVEKKGQQFRTMVLLAAYGGLRWGELAGLGIQHIDWLKRRVRVERQLHKDGRLEPPKTKAGTRWVEIPSWLCDELATTLALRSPAADLAPDHSDLFFLGENGTRLQPSNFTRRIWRPAVEASMPEHLAKLRFHDLRHTAVALYLESGRQAGRPINPKELQVRMGHSSIQMTLDRYGHLLDKVADEVVGAMASPFACEAGRVRTLRTVAPRS